MSLPRGVHTFECEGFLATDQTRALRFTFRVFADGALTARVALAPQAASQVHSADPVCYVYDGRAVPRAEAFADPTHTPDDGVFQCSFKLVRFWRHQLQGQFLVCHVTLSPSKGLQGHYVVVHGGDDRPAAREVALPISLNLWLVQHTHAPLTVPMKPLTPGKYNLSGFTVTSSGTVYECLMEIHLQGDGTLHGTSQDLLFPQKSQLRGKWHDDEITFTLAYKLGAASSSQYLYTVTPTLGGLAGRWSHQDPMRNVRPSERGHVELHLGRAARVWSRAFHTKYPLVFQHVTKLLLVRSLRAPVTTAYALPPALWQHVLAFCDFHHFAEDLDMDSLKV